MKFSFDTWSFIEHDRHAHRLAFAGSNGDLSWKALEQQVETYVRALSGKKLQKGRPVIIYGHKQKEFPALMLAALCYGIPYIPVDDVMPPERVMAIAGQTGPTAVFNLTGNMLPFEGTVNNGHGFDWIELQETPPVYLDEGTAYMIFTSGSTGVPKGVIISRKSLCNFSHWMREDYPIDENTVFINQVPFSFDVSLVDFVGSLVTGGSAIFNTAAVARNPELFFDRINHYKGNFWNSTPSFALLCSTSLHFNSSHLPAVRFFLFSGEELTSRLVQRVYKGFGQSRVFNAYGPTEATFAVTLGEMTPQIIAEHSSSLPIGYPKKDSPLAIYLDGKILPEGEEGELLLGGDNIATGYLNNAALTAEKFREVEGIRYYFTGDFGYYKNGMVFYKGRRDDQIKLNGFRIELGEINHVLAQVSGVDETVALPLKTGNQVRRIISFVKAKPSFEAGELKTLCTQAAEQKLPAYMVPSEILVVNELPYNNNHKIDKNQLLDAYMNGMFENR